jgi:mono/diheme cytochrome c family protein
MMRVFAGTLLGFVAMAAAGAVYVRVTHLQATATPGSVETRLARTARALAVPSDVRERRNPVPASPEALADGMAHYADHCATCHANDGSGNTEMGRHLYPPAPDMRAAATQQLTDGELFYVIEHGVRFTGMPGWTTGTSEGEESSWRLVHFIRQLPRLSEDDLARMRELTPRSPDEVRQEIEEEQFLKGANE